MHLPNKYTSNSPKWTIKFFKFEAQRRQKIIPTANCTHPLEKVTNGAFNNLATSAQVKNVMFADVERSPARTNMQSVVTAFTYFSGIYLLYTIMPTKLSFHLHFYIKHSREYIFNRVLILQRDPHAQTVRECLFQYETLLDSDTYPTIVHLQHRAT